jgi:LmbE family N-acetylglucosaminyl deacetylase
MRSSSAVLVAILAAPIAIFPQDRKNILVVTAGSGDYLFAAGGTLAKYIHEGYTVNVAEFGNDEKLSAGLTPAQTRLANVEEGLKAAKLLGVNDTVYLGHKSGDTGYVSSTEMRSQLFALIRHFKPQIIFIPDPYVHYQADRDQYWVGKMAEDGWGYSGAGTFANELARAGLPPYSVPEIYYYSMDRPYRAREGGEGRAKFVGVEITSFLENKLGVIELLNTRNRLYTLQTIMRLQAAAHTAQRLSPLTDATAKALARAFVIELAQTIGKKHGFLYGEEFNYVGGSTGLPPYVLNRAVSKVKARP